MANNIYKIFVNSNGVWESIELDDINLSTTFSVEDITDISKRKDIISKSLVLKGTKQNNKVFGALYSIDRDVTGDAVNPTNLLYNYKPNKYLNCFVLENNVEIIRGKLIISSVEVNKGIIFYNANIIGSVFSFFNNLSDRLLEELNSFNVSPYNNLLLDATNIKESWSKNNFNTLYDGSNSKYDNILQDSAMSNYVEYGADGSVSVTDSDSTKIYRADINPVVNGIFGIQTGVMNRNVEVAEDEVYTLSFKMRGNIEAINYGFLMRPTGGNSNVFNTDLPNLSTTDWNTYTIIITAPWSDNTSWVMLGYKNENGGTDKWFEIKDLKLSKGNGYDNFTYNIGEFKYQPYVYPMIDYGGGGFTEAELWNPNFNRFRWDVYRPAIYVKSYLDAIFRGFNFSNGRYTQLDSKGKPISNFRWSSSLKSDKNFNKLIIPHNEAEFSKSFVAGELPTGGGVGGAINILSGIINGGETLPADKDAVIFRPVKEPAFANSNIDSNFVTTSMVTLNGKAHRTFTTTKAFKGKITIKGNMNITDPYINPNIPIYATQPIGIGIALVKLPSANSTSFGTDDIISQVTTVSQKYFPAGKTSDFELAFEGDFDGRYVIASMDLGFSTLMSKYKWENTSYNLTIEEEGLNAPLLYGSNFNLFSMIPKGINIKDFLKNIMLMFNLYMIADIEDETLFHLYTYEEFYDAIINFDKDKAIDWTDKIDWETYTINTNIDLPKSYEYRYKEDTDYFNSNYKKEFNEVYGEYKLLDSSGLVSGKKTEIFFSPTINTNWKLNLDVPAIYETGVFGKDQRKPIKSNLRILYFNGEVSNGFDANGAETTYVLIDNNGVVIPDVNNVFGKYGYASMVAKDIIYFSGGSVVDYDIQQTLYFDAPLRYWNSDAGTLSTGNIELMKRYFLYHRFHRYQIRELTDPNIITLDCDVFLSEYDISLLDFRIPVYIQSPYGSSYFKILKIDYSDANTPANVKFQKIVLPDSNIKDGYYQNTNLMYTPQIGWIEGQFESLTNDVDGFDANFDNGE